MRKIKMYTGVLAMFVFLLSNACKRDVASATEATVDWEEPLLGDTVIQGEEVHAEGVIQANGEMHGYALTFADSASSAVLFNGVSENHADQYAFHEHWVNTATDTITVNISVLVTLDHHGNTMSSLRKVVCLP